MKLKEAEIRPETVYAWLNKQIKANKLAGTGLFENRIKREYPKSSILVFRGIKLISQITGIPYEEREWSGNSQCSTNHVERVLFYKDYCFYEIADKEEFEQEDEENEEKFTD